MTLHKKTLLVTGLTLLALFGLLYLTSQLILSNSFQQLEDQYTIQNVQRAQNALDNEIKAFKSIALGWSKWDDVYHFVDDKNQAFIDSNITATAFTDSDVDLMVFVDKYNRIVLDRAFDKSTGEAIPVSPALKTLINQHDMLVNYGDVTSEWAGLLKLPQGYLMTVSLPILTSLGEGPINGALIWGRYLNTERIAQLSDALDLNVKLVGYYDLNLPQAVLTAKQNLTSDHPFFAIPENAARIAGYTVIHDLDGKPIALLRVELPRTIYAQGQQTISYFLLALVLIGITYSVVNFIHLDRSVLRWLSALSAAVTQVRTTGNLKLPINIPSHDELANLAAGLQSMLDALAVSRNQLQAANAELEQRVQARTTDLTKAIALLQVEVTERQQAQERALEASRFKSQILANVSHDSRAPLSTIMLYVESMQRGYYGPITDKQAARLEGVMTSATQLLSFINNLLDEAQLNSGSLKLNSAPFSPDHLLRDVGFVLTPQAERKGLTLAFEIDPTLPASIMGDAERLKQVVLNLIDNAIKFTDQGGITVSAMPHTETEFMLTIADTGRGIPAEAQSRIFDAFWQVDGKVKGHGVGLGLSIVKQIITLMGGTIDVTSELGHGTTFTVILPLRLPPPPQSVERASAPTLTA
ncbi:MAG: hypothetical protein KF716_23265 [Anaerolineae bacterium]|nr:hypothetical protein [Anaerolineae bacterium]